MYNMLKLKYNKLNIFSDKFKLIFAYFSRIGNEFFVNTSSPKFIDNLLIQFVTSTRTVVVSEENFLIRPQTNS